MQPLDVGLFSPLKGKYDQYLSRWLSDPARRGRVPMLSDIPGIFKLACNDTFKRETAINAFSKAGIWRHDEVLEKWGPNKHIFDGDFSDDDESEENIQSHPNSDSDPDDPPDSPADDQQATNLYPPAVMPEQTSIFQNDPLVAPPDQHIGHPGQSYENQTGQPHKPPDPPHGYQISPPRGPPDQPRGYQASPPRGPPDQPRGYQASPLRGPPDQPRGFQTSTPRGLPDQPCGFQTSPSSGTLEQPRRFSERVPPTPVGIRKQLYTQPQFESYNIIDVSPNSKGKYFVLSTGEEIDEQGIVGLIIPRGGSKKTFTVGPREVGFQFPELDRESLTRKARQRQQAELLTSDENLKKLAEKSARKKAKSSEGSSDERIQTRSAVEAARITLRSGQKID
ncbi:unnamed protein product [Allacma fusca]|uniref:Uncharacterized protein n=1 Tax=Allacma fusca TaxID=39272 RepID=A0A8J2KC66_9HEXA|nr:unnamed protein product [Allacma fusca]